MLNPSRSILSTCSLALCAGALFLASSCGGGGGGSGGSQAASVDLLIGDAPSDELLAFSATLQSLQLVQQGGATTQNLLAAPVALEFLGLQGKLSWLATALPAAGTYTGVQLDFTPGSYAAIDQSGAAVAVNAAANTWTVALATPIVVQSGSYARLSIDLDLLGSLSGSLASPPLLFAATGSISDDSSSGDDLAIDEFKGVVSASSPGSSSFTVDAFVDDDLAVPMGSVAVELSPSTLLVDDDGAVFGTQSAFFAALAPSATLVEVHGALDAQGHVIASKVEIEDQSGGSGSANQVKIEGLVLALDADSFELAIQEIEKGEAIAAPVLANLGNPGSIEVGFGPATKFYLDSSTPTTSASLALGQKLKVRFSSFASAPFPAAKVEIEDEHSEFEGTLTSLAGLPNSLVMHLSSSEHWIPGTVASSNTDVLVDLVGATSYLNLKGKPALSSDDLVLGMKIEVQGSVAAGSTPSAPIVTAAKLKVHPGRVEGVPSSFASAAQFTLGSGEIEHSFGANVAAFPLGVLIEPDCVFEKDASSAAQLLSLFDALGAGQTLTLRVEGIGSGNANEIRAFSIRAELEGSGGGGGGGTDGGGDDGTPDQGGGDA